MCSGSLQDVVERNVAQGAEHRVRAQPGATEAGGADATQKAREGAAQEPVLSRVLQGSTAPLGASNQIGFEKPASLSVSNLLSSRTHAVT